MLVGKKGSQGHSHWGRGISTRDKGSFFRVEKDGDCQVKPKTSSFASKETAKPLFRKNEIWGTQGGVKDGGVGSAWAK